MMFGAPLQGLVSQLRTQLADAHQETSTATAALTASTELAGRLQAAAEVTQERAAAAAQRVAHEHGRTVADLEHRLQQTTLALRRSTESATALDAERHRTVASLQQRLNDAVEQSSVSATRNSELTDTVRQIRMELESAQTSMAGQASDAQSSAAELRNQVGALQQQLNCANQEAAAAASRADAAEAITADADNEVRAALQQAAQEYSSVVAELEQRLQNAEAALQKTSAAAAQTESDRVCTIQSLQQRLSEAVEEGVVAQGLAINSADTIADLRSQLDSAQHSTTEQAQAHEINTRELHDQLEDLQEQLAELHKTAAADARSLLLRSSTAEESLLESEAALSKEAADKSQIIHEYQNQLQSAQTALRQATQSAAQAEAQRQHSILLLQQRLDDASEQEHVFQDSNSALIHAVEALTAELASVKGSLLGEQQERANAAAEMHNQLERLQHQHACAQLAAEAAGAAAAAAQQRAASAEASAWDAGTQLRAVVLEKQQSASHLEQQVQTAQAALQQTTKSVAAADAQRQSEVHSLQQRLDGALQQCQASQTANTQLSDSIVQLKIQLQCAQDALAKQSHVSTVTVSQLQSQVQQLQQQLVTVKQEADVAAAEAASVQQAYSAAAQSHQEVVALLQQTVTDKEDIVSDVENRLIESQTGLRQAVNAAAATELETQQCVQSLEARLGTAVQQANALQTANAQLSDATQQLRVQLQYGKNAMAKQAAATESAVALLHNQVESLQQELVLARQDGAAAAAEATSLQEALAASEAFHQAAVASLQNSALEKDGVVNCLEVRLQDVQSALLLSTDSAAKAVAERQDAVWSLQQNLDAALQQVMHPSC